jgi:hypothetical protein
MASIVSPQSYAVNDSYVFLNPDNLGDFTTAQEAIAAVGDGGTLMISGTYDVPTHGIIAPSKAIMVVGMGWGRTFGAGGWVGGTLIQNVTNPLENCFDFTGAFSHCGVKNLQINHLHATGYAITHHDTAYAQFEDINIMCDLSGTGAGVGYGGFHQTQTAVAEYSNYWARYTRIRCRDFVGHGIHIEDTRGTKNLISDCDVQSRSASALSALRMSVRGDTQVKGGQFQTASGDHILIVATTNTPLITGHIIENTLHEVDGPGVKLTSEIGASGKCSNILIRNPVVSLKTGRSFVDFDYAEDCILDTPLSYAGTIFEGGEVCAFGANSANNVAIVGGYWSGKVITDAGTNNMVRLDTANAAYISAAQTNWDTTIYANGSSV